MVRVVLGIGSNINRRRHITAAVKALREVFKDVEMSPIYQSRSEGFEGPDFFNLAVAVETDLPVDKLQEVLRAIETREGRQRTGSRFSSRTMDIDILLYGDAVMRANGYDIPRDEILRFPFVLKPLADLEPERRHPENGETFANLWRRFKANHPEADLSQTSWKPDCGGENADG